MSLRRADLGLAELGRKVSHVAVAITETTRFAQSNAVDDRCVVELVADHHVVLVQQGFEQAAVGVETRRIKNGILDTEESRDPSLQLFVDRLGATDEADAGQAVSPPLERPLRGLDDPRIVGEAEIVVGAEVQHLGAFRHSHDGSLRSGYDALGLVEAGCPDGFELSSQAVSRRSDHRIRLRSVPKRATTTRSCRIRPSAVRRRPPRTCRRDSGA